MSEMLNKQQKDSHIAASSARGRRLLWFGIFLGVVLIGAVFAIAYHSASLKRQHLEREVEQQQKNLIMSRLFSFNSWLSQFVDKGSTLSNSEIFQLFASEVNKLEQVPVEPNPDNVGDENSALPSLDDGDSPASRLGLMRVQLIDVVNYIDCFSGRIVNSRGEQYISTSTNLPSLSPAQIDRCLQVVKTGALVFGPISNSLDGQVFDLYLPIMGPSYQQDSKTVVAVLILTKRIDAMLSSLLAQETGTDFERTLHLVQKTYTATDSQPVYQIIIPSPLEIRLTTSFTAPQGNTLEFAPRKSVKTNQFVYSSGFQVGNQNWWLVAEDEGLLVNNRFTTQAKTIYGLAGLISLALVLLLSAVWWWLIGREQTTITTQFKELLVVIENQKKLLDGINNTISDPISLIDGKGVYHYVNKAFATAVGRTEAEIIGLDGPAVFGFDTAKRLNASDQHVLMTSESITVSDVLWLQSKRYDFQISKTPYRDLVTRAPQGVVSVYRDVTQLVETEKRSRRVVQQTIDALVRAIEEADPFLGGHSRIMGGIAVLIAKQLQLSDSDIATIEAAANLSQVGKMFVPREILLKPGLLTPAEKLEMEQHVEHSRNILKGIEFDLPVIDAIYQMNEFLNGKGYPKGLVGEEISMHARVLAVANAFTAMARPRAYRPAIPVTEVLAILGKQTDSYDTNVVTALCEVLATPAGERLAAMAASGQKV